MTVVNLANLDPKACGIRLYRHSVKDELIACELVMFTGGAAAINTVLRRAALSGTVKIEPFDDPMDYFADIYVDETTLTQSVCLDRRSYNSLKTRWMRCKLETEK